MIHISSSLKLSEHTIWYKKPSDNIKESLPLGNGRLTALVSGDINDESICINDYSSTISEILSRKGFDDFDKINQARELFATEREEKAQSFFQQRFGDSITKYVPMANIRIHSDFISRISKYRRELRLDKAVHKVTFCTEGKNYTRESFVSSFAQVFTMRLSCDKIKSINFSMSIECDSANKVFLLGNTLCISGSSVKKNSSFSNYDENEVTEKLNCDVPFLGTLSIKNFGGTVIYANNTIKVIDADEVIIYFALRTKAFETEKNFNINYNDYNKQCFADIHYAQKLAYFDLINQSIAEHKVNYEKCCISLEDERNGRVSTDVRLKRHSEGQTDYALYPLLYNIGKYLSITFSQYSTDLSQIVEDEYCPNFSWSNKNKIKFWPVYPYGLFETYEPFLNYMEKIYAESLITTKNNYHVDGWVYNSFDDDFLSLKADLGQYEEINFYQVSSGWISLLMWNYYLYNQKSDYLERIYPIINDAALFFKQLLVLKDDYYILPASSVSKISKEISDDEDEYSPVIQETVYLLFKAVSNAQDILNIKNEYSSYIPKIKRSDFFINGNKCDDSDKIVLSEYTCNIIHLIGSFKFHKAEYVRNRLQKKIIDYKNSDNKTCSLGWKVKMSANIFDGDQARNFLDQQLELITDQNGILNMSDYYNKYSDINPIYRLFANIALCSGMINMFIQLDEDGKPCLLPALPSDWMQGKVSEMKIPGNKKICFSWKDGKVTDYKIEDNEVPNELLDY